MGLAVLAIRVRTVSKFRCPQTKSVNWQLRCARSAPACLCCTGNLTLRVTLNRILRHPPQHLYISLANSEHLPALCNFLGGAQYVGWLLPPVILDVGRAAIT